jgi:hypothetical protein
MIQTSIIGRGRATLVVVLPVVALAFLFLLVSCAGRDVNSAAVPDFGTVSQRAVPAATVDVTGTVIPGGVKLEARIDIRGRLPGKATLRLLVPEGCRIAGGATEEEILEVDAGTSLSREWVVEGAGGSFQVSLRSRGDAAGISADAVWPKPSAPVAEPVGPRMEPIPPIEIHGVTIDESVPVGPSGRKD